MTTGSVHSPPTTGSSSSVGCMSPPAWTRWNRKGRAKYVSPLPCPPVPVAGDEDTPCRWNARHAPVPNRDPMKKELETLLRNNQDWAERVTREDPTFFERLSKQQAPKYLWIGCSDSRVPANQVVDLVPGEVFVHRNIANVMVHTDLNCMSAIQFAVDVLEVRHILVVGHYG